ncbi:AAA family ATPase [Methylobacter psychrophilus]|uniref:AAA family ATPase n=1 Tax=Methylobacter psychrophilus TaxID=96941 RepID=UPI0021D4EF9E|nr:AAA family ATPase [Methylobacter psychrophilus]
MKIHNIHFKNINSLEGESQVNFEQAPFSDTGVFAITGPNGSGKSSILDVITLGLYGETFRFNRPASHVMTKRTTECFAAIEFSLGGERYKSSWHVQRTESNPDSELMPPEMQLIRLKDDEILARTHHEVCAKMTEITGMNFRNFTRSIMLTQGDFSAFLNALDSERMDILEKIISTDIYADYKKDILDKAENAQQELDLLKQKLAAIQFMDPEKREASEHDLSDFKEQFSGLQAEQNTLKQQQALLTEITAIKKQIVEQEKNLEKAKQQVENTQDLLDQIAAAQGALIFKDDIEAHKLISHVIHQGKATLDDFQSELKQLKDQLGDNKTAPDNLAELSFTEQQKKLDNAREQVGRFGLNKQSETAQRQSLIAQAEEKKAVLVTVSTWLEEHAPEALLLTDFPELGKLKKLRTEMVELSAKKVLFIKQSKKTTSSVNNNNAALAKEINKQAELKLKLQADEKELETIAQGKNIDDINALRLEQQERVKDFETLYNLAKKHQALTGGGGFFSLFTRKEQPEHDVDVLSLELEKLKLEIKREENIKRVLDESIIHESLLKKMAPDRIHLIDGKPCPFCGALQHPYAKHPPVVGNSRQALIDQKTKIRALIEKSANIGLKISNAQNQSEKNQARQTQLLQIRAQWLTLCNRLNIVSDDLDIKKSALMKELIKKEKAELADIAGLATKYWGKLASIEKAKALIAKSITTIEQLQISAQQMGSNSQGVTQEEIDLEAALMKCEQEAKQLADKILEQLTLLGEKMPGKGQEDALFDKLNVRRQDYHGYTFRHKNLTEELADLEANQVNCQAEITRCNELLEIYTNQLQSEETIVLHLALIEKQKLIADKEQLLAQQEFKAANLHQALQEKMQGTQFASLHEISQALELIESQSKLERRKAELEQEIDAENIELEAGYKQLQADLILPEAILNKTDVDEQLTLIAEKVEIASMEVQHLERLLSEQQQLLQTYDAVQLQVQQQEVLSQPYLVDAALITAENGMAFRRRVQGQVADKLLSQTNTILEKISGRYYLRKAFGEQGFGLEIEDTYQANVRRLPKTLSGGESFIVSLALALGLSELANNGRSVDSLFLDEGFGNLDADSLYTVISTLENLHTHGKTVGVISHVEAVQKRFKAQLQMVKKPNGMSELKKAS